MRYTVVWTRKAQQELATAWMNAADRNAVVRASNTIDEELGEDPDRKGDLRFDTVRSLIIVPLGIEFEVVEADRLVYVVSVWVVPAPPKP